MNSNEREISFHFATTEMGIDGLHWGFTVPTCFIDTQSAPALVGIEPEQKYMRAFLMAGRGDLVVTDFPLNQKYVFNYLGGILELELPQFLVVPDLSKQTVSDNLLGHPESLAKIDSWLKEKAGQLLFFNVTQRESRLAEALGNPKIVCGNVEGAIHMGSKTGFKKLCQELELPTPFGSVCFNVDDTTAMVEEIMRRGKNGFIKIKEGTGGTDLQSNVLFSASEMEQLGMDKRQYVCSKLTSFGKLLGDEWVVEEMVEGKDGSIHYYIDPDDGWAEPLVLGAISRDNSYVGGYFPYNASPQELELVSLAGEKLIPLLKSMNVTGFHCFDFKGGYFLEDNVRPGALDFVHQFVVRIAERHFPGLPYSWYHCHVPIPRPMRFEDIFSLLGNRLIPISHDGCFGAVSNVEVLPYGRALDLTAISIGEGCSVEKAQTYFQETKKYLLEQL